MKLATKTTLTYKCQCTQKANNKSFTVCVCEWVSVCVCLACSTIWSSLFICITLRCALPLSVCVCGWTVFASISGVVYLRTNFSACESDSWGSDSGREYEERKREQQQLLALLPVFVEFFLCRQHTQKLNTAGKCFCVCTSLSLPLSLSTRFARWICCALTLAPNVLWRCCRTSLQLRTLAYPLYVEYMCTPVLVCACLYMSLRVFIIVNRSCFYWFRTHSPLAEPPPRCRFACTIRSTPWASSSNRPWPSSAVAHSAAPRCRHEQS